LAKRIPKKSEVVLFPASIILVGVAAFQAIPTNPMLAQALLMVLIVNDTVSYLMVLSRVVKPSEGVSVEPAPLGYQPVERKFINLSEDRAYAQETTQVKQRDPRLQQWAYAVAYNNAPMTQKKWCGGKRLFSKPEYERWIACLLEKGVITFANPKNPAGGYKPNGAEGWSTIKNIADMRTYIPLPTAILSQEQIRFVSARMRATPPAGEGMD
jgi:hypothetical protein